MTTPKEETVTLELPLSQVRHVAEHSQPKNQENEIWVSACRKALAARKSPYDRWKEQLHLPWSPNQGQRHERPVKCGEGHTVGNEPEARMLMAAAPKLLEALVYTWQDKSALPLHSIETSIRAAVPADVADYLLNEGTK